MTENMQENRAALADTLRRAYSASGDYVTQSQLSAALGHIETKISNSELRQRNWVLAGCLAIIVTFGGGYMSLVSKLDRLTEVMPQIVTALDGRKSWILRKDVRDDKQDGAIKIAVPSYIPAPYMEPPK